MTETFFNDLHKSNIRVAAATEELEAALAELGLPLDSPIISGPRALAAAEELQAAGKEFKEIMKRIPKD